MAEIKNIDTLIVKPEILIDKKTKQKLLNETQEESQVIVHCSYTGSFISDQIRIWASTYLFANDSSHTSKLILVNNITMHPVWMAVDPGKTINFTLIFSGLPKDCKSFDLIEEIPESGGFEFIDIQRNSSDVYLIEVN